MLLCNLLYSKAFCQHLNSLVHPMNKNSYSISGDFIYNYCTNKRLVTFEYPNGKIPNSNSDDSVYYYQFKPHDTKTFGFNFNFNRKVSKNFSIAYGIGFNFKKNLYKYTLYIDSNINKSDLKSRIINNYTLFVPIRISYYYKKFKFNVGNNLCFWVLGNEIELFQDKSKINYSKKSFLFYPYFNETISYQLFNKSNIYINLSAEQSLEFYENDGYNNWFLFGITYQFE
jgi:hypothetical protein